MLIPKPSGTGSFCGVFGAECASPLSSRFWIGSHSGIGSPRLTVLPFQMATSVDLSSVRIWCSLPGTGGTSVLGQPLLVFFDNGSQFGSAGEVRPLVRIVLHIVAFLAAVGVADIPPALAPHAVIALVVTGHGGTFAGSGGVLELGHEADPLDVGARRQSTQLHERWIEVEQLGGPVAALTRSRLIESPGERRGIAILLPSRE